MAGLEEEGVELVAGVEVMGSGEGFEEVGDRAEFEGHRVRASFPFAGCGWVSWR